VARGEDGRARRLVGTHLDITQLRLAEASGRDAAQRLQVTVEAADLGVWQWDRETGKLETNGWLERTLGFRPVEKQGREGWLTGWLEGEERERFNRFIGEKLDASDELLQLETRIRDASGNWKWINHLGRVIERDAAGRALRLSGVNVDITARKEAEESLKVEQERLARVVAAARLGLWDLDLLSGRTVVNDWVLELLGETRADRAFERDEWAKYFHPDDLPAMEAALDAHYAGLTPFFEAELRLRTASGQWLWIHTSGQVATRDSGGRPTRAAGVFQDIAARREAVSALETSEAKLRTVVEHSPVGIFLSDPAGTIIYVNPLLCELVGRSAEACLGEAWATLLDETSRARMVPDWHAFLRAPEGTYEVDYRFERAAAGERVVRVQVAAIRLDDHVIGLVGAFNDLTDWTRTAEERERLQRELQQAQKMDALGQLTGGIAHDFNNILASILGYVSLAQTVLAPEGNERIANYLGAVMSAGERARDLVAKMLEFSRNAPREDLQPVDPAPLIQEVARMMQAIIPSSIKLVVHQAVGPTFALLDPSDLHQLLVNLIVNARDALGPHGQIDIRLLSPHRLRGVCSGCHSSINGHYLVIEVEDNGSGIEADVLSRIFDPFFSTKSAGKGTGMGLSVVHGILHRGRGHVLVESRPGQGTRFRLLFPPAPVSTSDTATRQIALAEVPRGHGQRILVVDDEPLVAAYLSELFSLNGYAVDTAADGVEALERLEQAGQRYDLLLTDQTMPRMTGTELIARLRGLQPDLPIILCTGYSDSVDEQGALALGIREFIRKPVAPDVLLRSVAAVIG
jgi:PAS domain S-box-containing protein